MKVNILNTNKDNNIFFRKIFSVCIFSFTFLIISTNIVSSLSLAEQLGLILSKKGEPITADIRKDYLSRQNYINQNTLSRENMYLSPGAETPAVRDLQILLEEMGYLRKDQIDGRFGRVTEAAVRQYQIESKLKYRDGIVGRETAEAMKKDLAGTPAEDTANQNLQERIDNRQTPPPTPSTPQLVEPITQVGPTRTDPARDQDGTQEYVRSLTDNQLRDLSFSDSELRELRSIVPDGSPEAQRIQSVIDDREKFEDVFVRDLTADMARTANSYTVPQEYTKEYLDSLPLKDVVAIQDNFKGDLGPQAFAIRDYVAERTQPLNDKNIPVENLSDQQLGDYIQIKMDDPKTPRDQVDELLDYYSARQDFKNTPELAVGWNGSQIGGQVVPVESLTFGECMATFGTLGLFECPGAQISKGISALKDTIGDLLKNPQTDNNLLDREDPELGRGFADLKREINIKEFQDALNNPNLTSDQLRKIYEDKWVENATPDYLVESMRQKIEQKAAEEQLRQNQSVAAEQPQTPTTPAKPDTPAPAPFNPEDDSMDTEAEQSRKDQILKGGGYTEKTEDWIVCPKDKTKPCDEGLKLKLQTACLDRVCQDILMDPKNAAPDKKFFIAPEGSQKIYDEKLNNPDLVPVPLSATKATRKNKVPGRYLAEDPESVKKPDIVRMKEVEPEAPAK